jgi:hypothetical protein
MILVLVGKDKKLSKFKFSFDIHNPPLEGFDIHYLESLDFFLH